MFFASIDSAGARVKCLGLSGKIGLCSSESRLNSSFLPVSPGCSVLIMSWVFSGVRAEEGEKRFGFTANET